MSTPNRLGIGKLAEVLEGFAVVEYFDSPAEINRHHERVVTSKLLPHPIDDQMRVYYFDTQDGCWRIGRSGGVIDRIVYISLPNRESAEMPVEEVFVRWLKPIGDPWELLSERLTDTPYFHSKRHELVRHFIHQRSSSMGLTGLISSSIDIEDHQVDVVRRVLSDSTQRYLLADEVGLGKTVEAGVIVRQHILDRPDDHCVLIVVPASLVSQWQSEMAVRCQLSDLFGHEIEVVAMDEIVWYMGRQPSYIVVDEAHQLTRNLEKGGVERERFEKIKALSSPQVCSGLLLLSATPALRNEEGFLALLHLLDPLMHDMNDVYAFRQRVRNRQALADVFWSFTEDQDPMFLLGDVEHLRELFPADLTIASMLDELTPMLESADEINEEARIKIGLIRMHLSETHRLHRRILRNRRNEELRDLVPGRDKLFPIPYSNERFRLAEAELEKWRSNANIYLLNKDDKEEMGCLSVIYQIMINALLGDVKAFLTCIEIRLKRDSSLADDAGDYGLLLDAGNVDHMLSLPHHEGEEAILNEILEKKHLISESRDISIGEALKWISILLNKIPRLVVMTSSPAIANDLYEQLKLKDDSNVTRHTILNNEWLSRWRKRGNQILICDQSAEEGLNLQGQHCGMVHLDLPFSPNRIEQRLGRLDRFGSGEKIESVTLLVKDSVLSKSWMMHLDEAWNVFNESIASLQYLVDEKMQELGVTLFENGPEAVLKMSEQLIDSQAIQNEKNAIRNQDSLDAIEDPLSQGEMRRLESIDDVRNADFRDAVDDWMEDGLQFDIIADKRGDTSVIRYRYLYDDRKQTKQTLLAIKDFLFWFRDAIDKESNHPDYLKPLTYPVVFSRQKARRSKAGIARLGHPVVEAIRRHIRWDDRGVSFAMWRHLCMDATSEVLSLLFFRLDFVVEANRDCLAHDSSLERQADQYFPPIVETVWVDEHLNMPDEHCLKLLLPAYREYRKYRDSHIRPQLWAKALSAINCDDWVGLCKSVRIHSEKALSQRHKLPDKIEKSLEGISERHCLMEEQLKCRIKSTSSCAEAEKARLLEELDEISHNREILKQSISAPMVRLDSAGVVILSNTKLED